MRTLGAAQSDNYMMIFTFTGRAGDLPLALLRHANNELHDLNEQSGKQVRKVNATSIGEYFNVINPKFK